MGLMLSVLTVLSSFLVVYAHVGEQNQILEAFKVLSYLE